MYIFGLFPYNFWNIFIPLRCGACLAITLGKAYSLNPHGNVRSLKMSSYEVQKKQKNELHIGLLVWRFLPKRWDGGISRIDPFHAEKQHSRSIIGCLRICYSYKDIRVFSRKLNFCSWVLEPLLGNKHSTQSWNYKSGQ